MEIRTAFVFDETAAYTLENEVEAAIESLEIIGLKNIKVAHSGHSLREIFGKRFDLVIIDYGGASLGYGSATATVEVDAACRWAENHPGALVVIWTKYTAMLYEDELQAEFGHLDNVLLRYDASESVYGNDLNGPARFQEKLRQWFDGDHYCHRRIDIYSTPGGAE